MTTHQAKKLDTRRCIAFRDRFALPLSDARVRGAAPSAARRRERRDPLPARRRAARRLAAGAASDGRPLAVPGATAFAAFALEADGKEMTHDDGLRAHPRNLLKDETLGPRVVPIVADEARTFGMADLFRQSASTRPSASSTSPRTRHELLYYQERDGQILEEGITEAGALSSWIAGGDVLLDARPADAAVLHLLLDVRLPARRRPDLGRGRLARARLPDRRDRGPHHARRRRPAAPGRHEPPGRRDGAELPRLRPGFADELAVILDDGMRRMLDEQKDVFYYVTVMNENYAQPSLPAEAHEGVHRAACTAFAPRPRQRAAGAAARRRRDAREAVEAAATARGRALGVAADLWSVTSFTELAPRRRRSRDRLAARRDRRAAQLRRRAAGADARADRHRHRLRARRAGADPRLPAAGRAAA